MYDGLDKLASLSLRLQSNSVTVIEEHNWVLLTEQAIKQVCVPGKSNNKQALWDQTLSKRQKICHDTMNPVHSVIIDSISARMCCNNLSEKYLYEELLKHGKVLYPYESTKNNIKKKLVCADARLRHHVFKVWLRKRCMLERICEWSFRKYVRSREKKRRKLSNSRQPSLH